MNTGKKNLRKIEQNQQNQTHLSLSLTSLVTQALLPEEGHNLAEEHDG
jgi:hypothetical protein